jgi:ribosomal-protein-serine acetyltransferase
MPTVTFRSFDQGDAVAFLDTVQRYADDLLPWVDTPKRVTDLARARDSVSAKLSSGQPARFGVFLGGKVLGSAKLIELDTSLPDYEIGIWCIPSWRGKGLGKWLMESSIDTAFSFGAIRISLRHAINNVASRSLIESVGAIREGRLRCAARIGDMLQDTIIYSVLQTEWSQKKAVSPCQRLFPEF